MTKKRLGACSQASVALISASSAQDSKQSGKSKLTQSVALCLPTDSRMQDSMRMSAQSVLQSSGMSMSSSEASLVRTSAQWERERVLRAQEQGFSGRHFASSSKYGPSGWSLKMSWACSIATMAKTFRQSSRRLPRAGMWDYGECMILHISESPKDVAEFSWLQVLDSTPPLTCFLTPHQLMQYLARLARSNSHGPRMDGLPALCLQKTRGRLSVSVVKLLSLTPTHGIRWLSGPECLQMQGFAPDWMRPTMRRLGLLETPSPFKSRSGSPKS